MYDRINKFSDPVFWRHMREVTAVGGAVVDDATGVGPIWVKDALYEFEF